ncbi:MAG: 23S rRNA (adenine(1618)-N(6))-methyltransferase RlmF [Bacteroides sp.]
MAERNELHHRSKHNGQYDFPKLIADYPPLEKFVERNRYGTLTVDFFNPRAVKALNKALLISCYGITYWNIPPHYLCPPIPGRADYIHYLADLLETVPPREDTKTRRCLDIGVGANCIYPIIGCTTYGWTFVGTDIDSIALANARKIATSNPILAHHIELRLQPHEQSLFQGIILPDEYFDLTLCNPPFHSSQEEAEQGTLRKLSSLKGKNVSKVTLNFGGIAHELWCDGGELNFLFRLIDESRDFCHHCGWFTTLVSKEKNLSQLYTRLKAVDVAEYRTIDMQQGTKSSRILAWRFA